MLKLDSSITVCPYIFMTFGFPPIYSGFSEVAKFLLSRGVNVDAESEMGTPLALAAFRGYDSTVKVLLEHNADVRLLSFLCWLSA